MSKNKRHGDIGEKEISNLVPCPNCLKKLVSLPKNYPLYDMQCTGCSFRVQVKTNYSKPKKEILGAGWDIMNKVLRSGFITPPLFTYYKWKNKREVRFYPFIPKSNLKKSLRNIKSQKRKYWMFNYIGLDKLPHFVVYKK